MIFSFSLVKSLVLATGVALGFWGYSAYTTPPAPPVEQTFGAVSALTVPQGGTGWGLITPGTLIYGGSALRIATTSTTTLTASSPLSLSNPVAKVGGSNSVLTIDTSGAWTGNAGTATALAGNGTNCSAGQYARGVDASGNAEDCTADSSGGGGVWPFVTSTTWGGVATQATSTLMLFQGGAVISTSSIGNLTTGTLTATSTLTLSAITDKTLSTDVNGRVYGTATSTATISSGLTYSATWGNLVGGTSGNLTCTTGTKLVFGCLPAADYNIFNNKIGTSSALTNGQVLVAGPLGNSAYSIATGTLSCSGNASCTSRTIIGGDSLVNATTSPTVGYVTATSTSIASIFPYASTTMITASLASTTNLTVSALNAAACDVKSSTSGVLSCGTDSSGGGGVWPFTTSDTNYGVTVQSTTTPEWFKAGLHASTTSHFAQASSTLFTVNDPTSNSVVRTAVNLQTNRLQIGPVKYPADYVTSCPTCMYLSIDKSATADDATIVLRDQGNARAEIGMVGDNDLVLKTVSGTYGTESFSTRLKIEGTGATEPGNVGIGLGETTDASDLLSVGTGNAFTVDYVGNVIASTSITINNPANGNAVLSVLGQQQSGGGAYIRIRDNVQGSMAYFGQNSVINGGTAYAQFSIQNPQSAGTICMSAGARASATAGTACDLFFKATEAHLTFNYASTTMVTATTASTTNLIVSGLNAAACDVKSSTNGILSCGTDSSGGGGVWPFTPSTWGGVATQATSTLMVFNAGAVISTSSIGFLTAGSVTATSTTVASIFPYASTTGISASYASTTAMVVSGIANSMLSTSNGVVTGATISSPLSFSGTTLSIANAAADGSTKGAASFGANDFDASSGNITIDYTNGQAATGLLKGFLTAANWLTFNNKIGTSSVLTNGQLLAAGPNGNTAYSIATSSATCTTNVSCSAFTVVGSVAPAITGIAWPFTPTAWGNSTSTLMGLLGGLMVNFSSSTITGNLQVSTSSMSTFLTPYYTMGFSYASTTQGQGTSTYYLGPASEGRTFKTVQCDFSNFLAISLYDGTNRANYFVASSTIGTITYATNNTFSAGEAIRVDIGTSTNIAASVAGGCRFEYTVQ